MAYAILIENREDYDARARRNMARWWRYKCIHRWAKNGELLLFVSPRAHGHLRETVNRLAMFGVRARIVRRPY